jgi:hypothetical protein
MISTVAGDDRLGRGADDLCRALAVLQLGLDLLQERYLDARPDFDHQDLSRTLSLVAAQVSRATTALLRAGAAPGCNTASPLARVPPGG